MARSREFDSPQATDILFDAIDKSDNEPDRTVTEAAVIASDRANRPGRDFAAC